MSLLVTACVVFVTFQQAQPLSPPEQDALARARAVIAAIEARQFSKVEEQFDEKMKGALPPGRLETLWNGLQVQAGALKGCTGEPRVVTIDSKRMVITPCDFERARADAQFAFDAEGRISGLAFRPAAAPPVPYALPSYANAASFSETETTIRSGEWTLPATLTVPAGEGPFPGVVLVHGSGPNDRDETVGANKPFKDLAVGLASRGIAVLRFEKRTKIYGAKSGDPSTFSVKQEVVDDAIAAAQLLRTQPKIDPARVFVLGHSLGGMLVPRIAAGDAKLAGVIVMAGAARPIEEAILAQTKYLAMADGTISPDEQKSIDAAAALVASVRALTPDTAKSGTMISNAPASYWFDLRGYDPPSAAKAIAAPILVLQGERDYQVTMEEFARWKEALGSRRDVTFHSYPALNHLFIAGTGPGGPAEYQAAGHVAEVVIRDIAAWVSGQPGVRSAK